MVSLKCMVLCISCLVVGSSATSPVPFIDKCTPEDSDCLLKSTIKALENFVNGIPEMGMEGMDPIAIKKPINADKGDLKLSLKDVRVTGARQTKFIKIERDAAKQTCHIELEMPINITAQYEMDGTLLLLPASGQGDCNIHSEKFHLIIDISLDKIINEDGDMCYKPVKYTHKYDFPKKVYIRLDNLFNGDKTQAEPIEKFIHDNSGTVVDELGPPIIEKIIGTCMGNIGKFFTKTPAKYLEIA